MYRKAVIFYWGEAKQIIHRMPAASEELKMKQMCGCIKQTTYLRGKRQFDNDSFRGTCIRILKKHWAVYASRSSTWKFTALILRIAFIRCFQFVFVWFHSIYSSFMCYSHLSYQINLFGWNLFGSKIQYRFEEKNTY